jgi:predicted RNase H-like HicB family nuclease
MLIHANCKAYNQPQICGTDMASKIIFTVEKTSTGFSAFAQDFETYPVGTTGNTFTELKENIVDALNLHNEHRGLKIVTEEDVSIQVDIPQFFQYYSIINAKALSERVGINPSVLSMYVNGHRKPSPKQVDKILTGIREIGKELSSLDMVDA